MSRLMSSEATKFCASVREAADKIDLALENRETESELRLGGAGLPLLGVSADLRGALNDYEKTFPTEVHRKTTRTTAQD